MYKKLLNKLLLEYFAPPLDLPPDNQESQERFHRLMLSTQSLVDETEDISSDKLRLFIILYKCETNKKYWYGQHGIKSQLLPSVHFITKEIAKEEQCEEDEVIINNFNEVSNADYDNFFLSSEN